MLLQCFVEERSGCDDVIVGCDFVGAGCCRSAPRSRSSVSRMFQGGTTDPSHGEHSFQIA